MKIIEKNIARKLRQRGLSLNEIRKKTGFTKSSISLWVRNIELSKKQKNELSQRGFRKEIIEKRRITRLANENSRRQVIIDQATKDIRNISKKELWLIGIALYWGEGAKTLRSGVQFSNSDPNMVKIIMEFFKINCEVPIEKFRGHIHLHPHLNEKRAKKYWSMISGIPLNQFYKTTKQQSRASKGKKDSLPFGTINIHVCNTELFLKIKG
ncbi:MAG: hypothetical protein HYS02_02665, partial [Candidatus Staskawiczbacteria bacterium]|nr:hypothetical protein [Candidatus Staskawiczbacteria bacterium]